MGLKDQLAGTLPPEILPLVPDRFEVIGTIAVLALPPLPGPYKRRVAEAIVSGRRNIGTVLNRTGPAAGAGRTACYETILGDTTVTVHRESGFSYRLDVARSFFSGKLVHERQRVAGQVLPGERVYVPFAGVGPFAIPAAARGAVVEAAEQNPDAYRWLAENIRLNRVAPACTARQGDALDLSRLHNARYDRLIIPAPYGMDAALDVLLPILSPGGTAHFYTFRAKEEIPALLREYGAKGCSVRYQRRCGNVAPGISRWVFDLERQ